MANRLGNTRDAVGSLRNGRNARVLLTLVGPAVRGYLLQNGKQPSGRTVIEVDSDAHFDWKYRRDRDELARLYDQAKRSQWDGATALDWSIEVDAARPDRPLMSDAFFPLTAIAGFVALPAAEKARQRHGLVAWMMSQFLHGEQGALFAACQVTQAVGWMDGKLYGSTQVVDEGRHVEVFHRYLTTKLEKLYDVNDNLYVVIESLMRDGRWDIKFLGMQILIEGLALGAFGTMRQASGEPLLRELLRYVMLDEARHVAFGVLALQHHYAHDLAPAEVREREDWAFEMAVLLRNRFLAHEFYDEYWAHKMTRGQWNEMVLGSAFMGTFRKRMFRRIVPNLKRIGLLSPRIRPHYAELGLLEWEHDKAAPELTGEDLVAEG
ncbi:MAG: ferritin-like domain-containing protein [Myxococcales bacterium]|nr:ferritin-like domain-containing protein [Myxococcales bacterium]